jgi:hypothetical protein
MDRPLLLVSLVFSVGCTGILGESDGEDPANGSGPNGTNQTGVGPGGGGPGVGGGPGAGGGEQGGGGAGGGGMTEAEIMCARWNTDRADMNEGTWSGNVGSCTAGDISANGRENALKLVNLYRFLAELPAVTHDPTRNTLAQACALMMDANNTLSHTPPPSWTCYTAEGSQGAGNSNIASTPGVMGVDLYIADPGNETTMGHRRWILSRGLGPIGLGSTSDYSCMWVLGGSGGSSAPWVAYPSPGPFPIEAMTASFVSTDETGWTVQTWEIDLGGAQVTITDDGQNMPVDVQGLAGGYGSTHAIKMTPQGWTSQAGHSYAVSVTGIQTPISYTVDMVACE